MTTKREATIRQSNKTVTENKRVQTSALADLVRMRLVRRQSPSGYRSGVRMTPKI